MAKKKTQKLGKGASAAAKRAAARLKLLGQGKSLKAHREYLASRVNRRGLTAARNRMGYASEATVGRAREVVKGRKGAAARRALEREGLLVSGKGRKSSGFTRVADKLNKNATRAGEASTMKNKFLVRNAKGNRIGERRANREAAVGSGGGEGG